MRDLQKLGGISALVCAGTYVLAMGLLSTILAPMADESLALDQFIAFFLPRQTIIFVWHFSMYLVNGTFLALLTLTLYNLLKAGAPSLAMAAACFGLLWTTLVFASGFITIYGWETIGRLASADPDQAALLRLTVDTVTIGLDHSDRFLGGLWGLLVGWAALRTGQLSKPLNSLGIAIGAAGIASSVAPALNVLGYAFGAGMIVWWGWLGTVLLRRLPIEENPVPEALVRHGLTLG